MNPTTGEMTTYRRNCDGICYPW